MADESTKVVLDLDNSQFVEKMKEALGLKNDFLSTENFGELAEKLGEIGAVAGVVTAGIIAVKGAIDLAMEAEKIRQVNSSFAALASSVGLSSEKLKEQLIEASKGLVSETDLLQAANGAIVKMGENANRLPEIMELARKATVVFGGELTDNFNQLSTALASGNVRMLKHYGIVVDATKAQDEYAAKLGISREYLDDTGKRLAVMNAALEQGKTKFANINEETLKTTNNVHKIGVAFTELKEIAVLAWDKVAGPWVSKMVEGVAKSVHSLVLSFKSVFAEGEEQEKAKKELLEQQIEKNKEQLEIAKKVNDPALIKTTEDALKKQQEELDQLNAKEKVRTEEKKKQNDEQQKAVALSEAEQQKKSGVDTEKVIKERQKLASELSKINKQVTDEQLKSESDITKFDEEQAAKKVAIEKAAQEQIKRVRKEAKDAGLQNDKQVAEITSGIEKKAQLDIQQVDRQTDQERLRILKNYETVNKNTNKGIVAGWDYMGEKSKQDFHNMAKFGEQSFNVIGQNATKAFENLGKGSQNAAEALKGFMFGAIGQIAEQQGEAMLLMGLWPPNPVAIAAGGALIALGAALQSAGGGGGGSTVSGGGGGGGSVSATSASATAPGGAQPTPQAAPPAKHISVNIAGHYMETDQTRTALMDIIRQAGDMTDFNLKQIGQP